jgi:hypothetical protein
MAFRGGGGQMHAPSFKRNHISLYGALQHLQGDKSFDCVSGKMAPSPFHAILRLIFLSTLVIHPCLSNPKSSPERADPYPPFQLKAYPSTPVSGPVTAQFTSTPYEFAFSAPKISAINGTSFEWYYFDILSPSSAPSLFTNASNLTSLVLILFLSTPASFPVLGPIESAVSVVVTARVPNGSIYFSEAPAEKVLIASGGKVFGDGAAGDWVGANASFFGSRDLNEFKISVDTRSLDPVGGVKADVVMQGRAPAHYPCSADIGRVGEKLEIVPHLGWVNAVPDSDARGIIELSDGSRYEIGGGENGAVGYHDHNWGDIPFPETIDEWYWGHARLGEWTLVFFDGTGKDGSPFADGYIAKDGEIVVVDCGESSVEVKEFRGDGGLTRLEVRYPLPKEKMLAVDVRAVTVNAFVEGVYERYEAVVTGGIVGKRNVTGVGMFEHFLPQ